MIAGIRAFLALLLIALATLVLGPVVWIGLRLRLWEGRGIVRFWHRLVARGLGIRIRVDGAMATARPLLIASNHVSYTDITVLGTCTDVSFIAKSDMAAWPVFGALARLQRSVFVERERKGKSGEQAGEIARRMASGDAMVLFAEGTTGDGNFVMPFKTTLFGAASMMLAQGQGETVWIQPVSIAYTRLNGLPMGRALRPVAAWIGDQDLAPHLRGLLARAAFDVEVRFGAPVAFAKGDSRKQVARQVEAEVRAMVAASLRDPA